ncbi:MAG TPA: HIT family protein [Polyangiaceae bacterium]|jgi:diadenosine tetraphosphate (Ap4A) HIT family hydrolase
MRRVEKSEALELLQENRRTLLGGADGCVMCALAAFDHSHPEFIAGNEHGTVVLDGFGSCKGHLLVISRTHVVDTTDLPWPAYIALQRLAYEACHALRRAFDPPRIFNAILGTAAQLPMSFPHFHIHALPVYETDERARPANVFSWSYGVLIYDRVEVVSLSAQIRAAWPARAESSGQS